MSANTFEDILKAEKPQEEEAVNNFTIYKADEDKRLVFGWASVSIKVDGEELEDRQHDMIDPEDMEEAAYEYVLNFRDTGEEHLPGYRKKGKLVESCVFTKDKQKAMGIPEGILPIAWWVGFKIEDDDTWQRVKDGTYRMFSIEGRAHREPVEKAAAPTGCGVLVIRDGKVLTGLNKRTPVDTKKVASNHEQDRVEGKDISGTFDYSKMKTTKDPIDAVAEAQGWNKAPTVTNDKDVFDKAVLQSGHVMIRTVHSDSDTGLSGEKVAKYTMTDGNFPLGGRGGQSFGTGMYMVATKIEPHTPGMEQKVKLGQSESYEYGDRQMMATLHPNAKIATREQGEKLTNEYYKLSLGERAKFGNDSNAYIASKGYDGVKWQPDKDATAYATIFNKSALIFYGEVAEK